MPTCPYCHSEVTELQLPMTPKMTKKQTAVYEFMVHGGAEGVDREGIMGLYFKGRTPTTLRTCIARINKVISPKRIRFIQGRLYLMED